MSLKLRDRKTFPQGGFPYIQPETGRVFSPMFSFSYQAKEIMQHRKDNNLARATMEQSADDLDTFTCNRNAELCYDPGDRVPEPPRRVGSCGTCGGSPR